MTQHWNGSAWVGDPDTKMFEGWSQEAVDLLLDQRTGYLGVAPNCYGTAMAVFRCTTCGQPFSITPIFPGCERDTVCGFPQICPGYDPNRDVAALMQDGAVLHPVADTPEEGA